MAKHKSCQCMRALSHACAGRSLSASQPGPDASVARNGVPEDWRRAEAGGVARSGARVGGEGLGKGASCVVRPTIMPVEVGEVASKIVAVWIGGDGDDLEGPASNGRPSRSASDDISAASRAGWYRSCSARSCASSRSVSAFCCRSRATVAAWPCAFSRPARRSRAAKSVGAAAIRRSK